MVNTDLAFKLLYAAGYVGSMALNVYLYFKSKSDRRFECIEETQGEHGEGLRLETADRKAADNEMQLRLVRLETAFSAVPTHEDLEEINAMISSMRAEVAMVSERGSVTLDGVRRIERFLLEHPR